MELFCCLVAQMNLGNDHPVYCHTCGTYIDLELDKNIRHEDIEVHKDDSDEESEEVEVYGTLRVYFCTIPCKNKWFMLRHKIIHGNRPIVRGRFYGLWRKNF